MRHGVNFRPRRGVVLAVKRLAALASAAVVALSLAAGVAPAEAEPVTCQGLLATVVGPNDGVDTAGTEGDDVIVAPLATFGYVFGYSGDDTICLVDAPDQPGPGPIARVLAGPGDDAVVNLRTSPFMPQVGLGLGADTYVGNDFSETVYGGSAFDEGGFDIEVDVIDTRGGYDQVYSGSDSAGVPNHDVVSTGAATDRVWYAAAGGGQVDDGPDADILYLTFAAQGPVHIDNAARRATVGDQTAPPGPRPSGSPRATPTSSVSFSGTDADESLRVTGSVPGLVGHAAIVTGGGDDEVDSGQLRRDRRRPRRGTRRAGLQGVPEHRRTDRRGGICRPAGEHHPQSLRGRGPQRGRLRGGDRPWHLARRADLGVRRRRRRAQSRGRRHIVALGREVHVFAGRGNDRVEVRGNDSTTVRGARRRRPARRPRTRPPLRRARARPRRRCSRHGHVRRRGATHLRADRPVRAVLGGTVITSRLVATISSAVLVAGLAAGLTPTAQARAETCQGKTPTIVGPTTGQNTTGTEGDDVIVAPINSLSTVLGLGGNDTICLVPTPSRRARRNSSPCGPARATTR